MSGTLYNVGIIVNTHGIKGEVKVFPQTDFPQIRFKSGSKLILLNVEQQTQIGVEVEYGRLQKNVYIVKFSGLDHIDSVAKYKGWHIKVTADNLIDLPEGDYYYHEIIGCAVITQEGVELGTISEILSPGANDVWVVNRPFGKPILLPVIHDVVLQVDTAAKVVKVDLMEGMID